MLVGMSIECYLKAYYVASGHKITRNKKSNKLETHGAHNLKAMAQKFNFQTSAKERSVLHYLSMYIRVKGRYPVPLQLKDMKIEDETPEKGLGDYVLIWESDYDDICIQMVTRLENEIKNLR